MGTPAASRDAGADAWLPSGPDPWELLRSTRRVARRVERKVDRLLAVQGLTFTHLEVLHVTWDRHSTTPGLLARQLGISRQGALQVLEKLARRGLIEVFVAESGRRCARLTSSGREQLFEGHRWLAEVLAAVDRIPTNHRIDLLDSLARLEVAVTARPAPPWWFG